MKKAKVMLTAITVLAVVGGAIAFKAETYGVYDLYTSVDCCCIKSTDNYGIGDELFIGSISGHKVTIPVGALAPEDIITCTFNLSLNAE